MPDPHATPVEAVTSSLFEPHASVDTAPHTSTEQWQSFEARMRHRRAERCLARANVSLDNGAFADARQALDEAKELVPGLPGIDAVEARLAGPRVAARTSEPPEVQDLIAATPLVVVDQTEPAGGTLLMRVDAADSIAARPLVLFDVPEARIASGRGNLIAAACLLFALSGWMGWLFVSRGASTHAVRTSVRHDITLAAPAESQLPALTSQLQAGSPQSPGEPTSSQPAALDSSQPPTPDSTPSAEGPQSPVSTTGTPPPVPARSTQVADDRPSAPVPNPELPVLRSELPEVGSSLAVATPEPRRVAVEPIALSPVTVPPARAEAAPRPVSAPDPGAAVRAALSRYESAYSEMNPAAARAVWPAVDQAALARAFDGLSAQRISLGACDVQVDGNTAHANCAGTAAWTPKIGGGQRKVSRQWTFDLRNAQGTWLIDRVATR